jgi:lipopolysaccharide export LptBFGC system permease protein LptF
MSLVKSLLILILACVVIWGAWTIIGVFVASTQIKVVLQVLVVVVVVFWAIKQFGVEIT